MRVLLCGGGTGGHVMPAIAIGEIICKNFPSAEIAFAGRQGGNENRAYKSTGRKLYMIDIHGISRSININNVKSLFKVIKSGRTARNIIKDFNPDIIIGTGGYVCYPFIRQGQRMKIRTVIHESNVYPGLVTRLLYKKCDALLLNLEGSKDYLKNTGNITVVGNPTRSGFGGTTKAEARRLLGVKDGEVLIVSFGGSLGAEKLNEAIRDFLVLVLKSGMNVRCIHATGKTHYNGFIEKYPEFAEPSKRIKVLPYIENMPTVLTAADMAITRSGAITIAELARSATPSILIPSPNVTANHQYINAEHMKKIGASELITEDELDGKILFKKTLEIVSNSTKRDRMSKRAHSVYKENTDSMIREVLLSLYNDKKR